MSLKITEALFLKNGFSKIVTPDDMDRESYNKIYKGFLFCPFPNCAAKLIYVDGEIQISHFRTKKRRKNGVSVLKRNEHIKECPNSISYKESEKARRRNDPEYKYNISDDHISTVLNRAYKLYKNVKPSMSNSSSKQSNRNKYMKQKIDYSLQPVGLPALFDEGEELTNGREPKIPVRLVENITEKDYIQVRCIIGEVHSFYLDNNYAYINLTIKNRKRVKIHFNEGFIANNRAQFELFHYVKAYVEILKEDGEEIICCCIGEIYQADSGLNVRPDRYSAFSINNKKFYAIVHELGVKKAIKANY